MLLYTSIVVNVLVAYDIVNIMNGVSVFGWKYSIVIYLHPHGVNHCFH